MNKVNELLEKYNFINKPRKHLSLDKEIQELNHKLTKIAWNMKNKDDDIIHKEIELIDNIIENLNKEIVNRVDLDVNNVLDKNYIIGESYDILFETNKTIERKIENQIIKEDQIIKSIRNTLNDDNKEIFEQKLLSDEFLEYILMN